MARRRSIGLLGALALILTALATVPPQSAKAYKTDSHDGYPVHETIADYAAEMYENYRDQQGLGTSDITNYLADIKAGAGNEDMAPGDTDDDHIFGWESISRITLRHFWEADNGPYEEVDIPGTRSHENAWLKAQALWSLALGAYGQGDKPKAYEYLGHVVHLLSDMSVPAHTREDPHPGEGYSNDDSYEEWMKLDVNYANAPGLSNVLLEPLATLWVPHDVQRGSTITVSGVVPEGFNGEFVVVDTTTWPVPTVTYELDTDPGSYESGGTVTFPDTSSGPVVDAEWTENPCLEGVYEPPFVVETFPAHFEYPDKWHDPIHQTISPYPGCGPLVIPEVQPPGQPIGSPWELYWLMYTTNQTAGVFASDDYGGDPDPLDWVDTEAIEGQLPKQACSEAGPLPTPTREHHLDADLCGDNDKDNEDVDGDLSTIRHFSYLYAIRAVGGLFKLFEETTEDPDLLTVRIDQVKEQGCDFWHRGTRCHDFWSKPDYYAAVRIGGDTVLRRFDLYEGSMNRGEAQENAKSIHPNWAFGATTTRGPNANLPVLIEIWDRDWNSLLDKANWDEQSDINPGGGRSLLLTVVLPNCDDGPGGVQDAVWYVEPDFTWVPLGKCGEPITVHGTANRRSELTFTIGFPWQLTDGGDAPPPPYECDGDPDNNTVSEDAKKGSVIQGAKACVEGDEGVTFSLAEEGGNFPFAIDPESGDVAVANHGQLDGPDTHTITVQTNSADGRMTSDEEFVIHVTNVEPDVSVVASSVVASSVVASSVSTQYSDPLPEVTIDATDVALEQATDAVQVLVLTGGTEGDTFALTYHAHECSTAVTIPSGGFEAVEAEDVEACLESISDWTGNADDIAVEKDGPEFAISFSGELGSAEIGPITVTSATGQAAGSVAVASKGGVGDTLSASAALPDAGTIPDGLTLTGTGGVGTGSWTLGGIADLAPGTYPVTVTVTDDDGGATDVTIQVVVTPEDATVTFDTGNPVAEQVASEGGVSPAFGLGAALADADDGSPGNIGQATLGMTLVPVGPGSLVGGSCTSAVAGQWSCGFDGVPVNTYTAVATVGGCYIGGSEDVLVVFDPSLGFTSGGGWYLDPASGDRVNFGYTMKYNKKATNVQGNLLVIRHTGDDQIYRLKSNALFGLAIGSDTSFDWASFAGKATYQEPGWPDAVGNYEFVVYVEDRDAYGFDGDRIWLTAQREGDVATGLAFGTEPAQAPADAVTIGGGNIIVPHQG